MTATPSSIDVVLNIGWVVNIDGGEGMREHEEVVISLRVANAMSVEGTRRIPWACEWPTGPLSLRGKHSLRWFVEAVVQVEGESKPAQSRRWVTVLAHAIDVRKDVAPPTSVEQIEIEVEPSFAPADGYSEPPTIPVLARDEAPDTGAFEDVVVWRPTEIHIGGADTPHLYDEASLRRIEVSRDATHLFVTLVNSTTRDTLQVDMPPVDLDGLPWLSRRGVDVPLPIAQALYQVVTAWGVNPARWFEEDTHAPDTRDNDDVHTVTLPVVHNYDDWWHDKKGLDERLQKALGRWARSIATPQGRLAWRVPQHPRKQQDLVRVFVGVGALIGGVLGITAGWGWAVVWVMMVLVPGTLWWLRGRAALPPPPERTFTSMAEGDTWGDVGLSASVMAALGETVVGELTLHPRHALSDVVVQWSLQATLQLFNGQTWAEHAVHQARAKNTYPVLAAGHPLTVAWQRRLPKRTLVSFEGGPVRAVWSLHVELNASELEEPLRLAQPVGVLPVVLKG